MGALDTWLMGSIRGHWGPLGVSGRGGTFHSCHSDSSSGALGSGSPGHGGQ